MVIILKFFDTLASLYYFIESFMNSDHPQISLYFL